MTILTLIITLFTIARADPAVITVTVVDGGRPQPGILVTFESEDGKLTGHCITGSEGVCRIDDLAAPAGFIRGHLSIGSHGRRSVTWPGGELTLIVDVNELGFDHPPHSTPAATRTQADHHDSLPPFASVCEPAVVAPDASPNQLHVCVVDDRGYGVGGVHVWLIEDGSGAELGRCHTPPRTACAIDFGPDIETPISAKIRAGAETHRLLYGGGVMEIVIDAELDFRTQLLYSNIDIDNPAFGAVTATPTVPNPTPAPPTASPHPPISPTPQFPTPPSPQFPILASVCITLVVVGMVGLLVYQSRKGQGG